MNRSIFIILFFLTGVFFTANAQYEKGDLTVMPQVGLNLSSYYNFLNPIENQARFDYNVGLNLSYFISDEWSLRTGAIYDQKGSVIPNTELGTVKERLNYLSIPLHAAWNWNIDQSNALFLNFGPTIGLLLSEEFVADSGDFQDNGVGAQSLDYGLGFGMGYSIGISERLNFLIQTQAYYGFRPLTEFKVIDPNNNEFNLFNVSYSLSVGLEFKL